MTIQRRALRRSAVIALWAGVILFWLAYWALHSVAGLAVPDSILLSALLVALPALALGQVPMMDDVPIDRIPAYWSSIATLWILGTLSWIVGTREGGIDSIGAVWTSLGSIAFWSVALLAGGMAVIQAFKALADALGIPDSRLVWELLPRTQEEKGVFVILSIAAGTGEEVAYRGYAIPVLASILGLPGAVLLSSAVFGVLHAYQGPLGILRTTVMGLILALGFILSGSLIPAVIAHTLIDVIAGVFLADRLVSPPEPSGVHALDPPTLQDG